MTKPPRVLPFPDLRRIEEEAAEWVARVAAREQTPLERDQLESWLRRSPAHRDAWQRMASLWQGTAHSPALQNLQGAIDAIEPEVVRRRRSVGALALAASAAIAALGLVAFQEHRSAAVTTQSQAFATAPGVQRSLVLVDGSTVVLNVDSRAAIEIDRRERRIFLQRGEAYFQVAHESARPFLVDTGSNVIRATGTAFSVSVAGERVEVLVDQGRVEVAEEPRAERGSQGTASMTPARRITPLAVGQRAVVDPGVALIESIAPVDLERRLSWRGGVIVFAGEPLSEVVGQMSRYSGVPILIEDDQLRAIPIGGRFRVGDVDSMLEALESLFGVAVRRDADGTAHISVRR